MLPHISRRRFLKRLVVFGGASLLLPNPVQAARPPVWVAAGSTEHFKKGTVTLITLPDDYDRQAVYIRHPAEDIYLALLARCTHKGCTVDWIGHQFLCPCHNGRYDENGKNIGGPPPRPLPALETKVDARGILSILVP